MFSKLLKLGFWILFKFYQSKAFIGDNNFKLSGKGSNDKLTIHITSLGQAGTTWL